MLQLFRRSYRPVSKPCMDGMLCWLCFSTWQCHSGIMESYARRVRLIYSRHDDMQHQIWESRILRPPRMVGQKTGQEECPALGLLAEENGQAHPVERPEQAYELQSRLATFDVQRLCKEGHLNKAVDALFHMDQQGNVPPVSLFRSLLKECSERKSLYQAKRVHAHLAKFGLDSTRSVGEYVVSTLVKCGGLEDALHVFHRLPYRTVFSWTAVISGYAMAGQGRQALKMYQRMQEAGVQPNAYTFVSLLKACRSIGDVAEGRRIHLEALKHGCESDLFVGNCLIDMYGKCGSIVDAQNVFDRLSQPDVVSWNAMMATYIEQGRAEKAMQLYEQMQKKGVSPDARSLVSALQACGMLGQEEADQQSKSKVLEKGKLMHADACRKGHHLDVFVGSTLISMYGKCGSISDARNVFDSLLGRNVVSWNAMLAAYVDLNLAQQALELYRQMQQDGVSPGVRTFVSAVQACGMLAEEEENSLLDGKVTKTKSLRKGKEVHADAQRKGYDSNVFVSSALITMYGKCGSIEDSQNVFGGLSERNVVSWNAMLVVYTEQGQPETALQLYEQLRSKGVIPDSRTYVSALQACGMLAEKDVGIMMAGQSTKVRFLETGRLIHADAQRDGYDSHVFVGNTLISMYGKCGSMTDARDVFDRLSQRDLVSWNVMLAAYVEQGQGEIALELYRKMQAEGPSPDDITLVCVLQACSKLGNLALLRQIHSTIHSSRKELGPYLASALIHAYGGCASMVDAQAVFDSLPQLDVVSWTALIAGYAREGDTAASLQCYEKMQLAGLKPTGITFLSLLSACSHAGLVEKGVEYFEGMSRDYGLVPEIEHYVSMVDLLGRAGCFERLEDLLLKMPLQPNLVMWYCLLGACRNHAKVVLGKYAFDHAVTLEPKYAAAYVVMSNIYADAGLHDLAEAVNGLGQKAGASKKPGQSWIEYENVVHSFMVGNCQYPYEEQLYALLGTIRLVLVGKGVSQLKFTPLDNG